MQHAVTDLFLMEFQNNLQSNHGYYNVSSKQSITGLYKQVRTKTVVGNA